MNDLLGILGFVLIIVSGIFLDTPFIAILAIPVFLVGAILIFRFYLLEIKHDQKWLSTFLIVSGVFLFIGLTGYSAIEYNQYQGYLSRNPEIEWNWTRILLCVALNVLATATISFGIRSTNKYKPIEFVILVLPTLLVLPIILILIKLYVLSGSWMGASI